MISIVSNPFLTGVPVPWETVSGSRESTSNEI